MLTRVLPEKKDKYKPRVPHAMLAFWALFLVWGTHGYTQMTSCHSIDIYKYREREPEKSGLENTYVELSWLAEAIGEGWLCI